MLCDFKYQRQIQGKFYSKGQHDVPEKDIAQCDRYFKALIACGDILPVAVQPQVVDQPQAKAAKK